MEYSSATPATPATPPSPPPASADELTEARLAELRDAEWYCPGCGRTYRYQRECTGVATAPHPPIDVAPTTEVTQGGPENHTAAPPSE